MIPELEDWLFASKVKHYPFNKTFAEARLEPFVALHTSGSTGLPKLVVIPHGTVASIDAWHLIPSQGAPPTIISSFSGIRLFMPFPPFHAAGLYMMLPLAIFCNMTVVLPPTAPLTAEIADSIHTSASVEGTILPASVLTEIVKDPKFFQNLQNLDFVAFGGAPLPKEVGDAVKTKSWPINWLGATELCFTALEKMDPDDWEYMKFSKHMGVEFRHYGDDLYELFIIRDEALDPYQGIFCTFPNLKEYSMKDLYSKHPSKEGLWRYRGRADDIIVFSNGEKMNPLTAEARINNHEMIDSALVLGHGRFQSALLIEPANNSLTQHERRELLHIIWDTVEQANQIIEAHGRISKSLVMFTLPEKPMLRAGKGTIQRKLTLDAYAKEIEELYSTADIHELPTIELDTRDLKSLCNALAKMTYDHLGAAIDHDSDFFEHGLDSLQTINLSRQINNALKRSIADSKMIYKHPNINRLASAILKELVPEENGQSNESNGMGRTWRSKALFDSLASDLPVSTRPFSSTAGGLHVVLTGSTGSLGTYLLAELLKSSKVDMVYCLNRSPDAHDKTRRLFNEKRLPETLLEKSIQFLTCDLSRPYLGLSIPSYYEILQHATHVVHNAWEVDFNLSLESFSKVHLRGVRQLIDFSSRSSKGSVIFFISSIGTVAQWNVDNEGPVPEVIIDDWNIPQEMGYAESKYISERLLDEASTVTGIPTAVCRIGQIAGPTTVDGLWTKGEWLPTIIASSKYLKKIPETLGPMDTVDWIPVDILSRILIDLLETLSPGQLQKDVSEGHIASSREDFLNGTKSASGSRNTNDQTNVLNAHPKNMTGSKVFHAVNPSTTTWKILLPAIQEHMSTPLEVVSLEEWVDTLKLSSSKPEDLPINPGLKLLDFFIGLAEAKSQQPRLETKHTIRYSQTMSGMSAVKKEWMETWLKQWSF